MSVPYQLNPRRREEYLQEAVERQVPVVLSIKTSVGWANFKSRFLCVDSKTQQLVIEYPHSHEGPLPEVVSCQNVGVSFRRGHKKCMFSTMVTGRSQYPISGGSPVPAINLVAPSQMFELQRRMFYRTPLQEDQRLTVELLPLGGDSGEPVVPLRATLVDLSAGGCSLLMPANEAPDWPVNATIACSIMTEDGHPPIQAPCQFRHREAHDEQNVRLGLQFAGLDATPDGRRALQRILDLTCQLQRA